jgi:hypothetical protein
MDVLISWMCACMGPAPIGPAIYGTDLIKEPRQLLKPCRAAPAVPVCGSLRAHMSSDRAASLNACGNAPWSTRVHLQSSHSSAPRIKCAMLPCFEGRSLERTQPGRFNGNQPPAKQSQCAEGAMLPCSEGRSLECTQPGSMHACAMVYVCPPEILHSRHLHHTPKQA